MPQVRRNSIADRDIVAIIRYIAADNPSAAEKWLTDLESLFRLLAANPLMSERVETRRLGNARRRAFGNYVIYYLPLRDGVEILRVIHGARDQEKLV